MMALCSVSTDSRGKETSRVRLEQHTFSTVSAQCSIYNSACATYLSKNKTTRWDPHRCSCLSSIYAFSADYQTSRSGRRSLENGAIVYSRMKTEKMSSKTSVSFLLGDWAMGEWLSFVNGERYWLLMSLPVLILHTVTRDHIPGVRRCLQPLDGWQAAGWIILK